MGKETKNCLNRVVPDGKFFKPLAFTIENAAFTGNLLMVHEWQSIYKKGIITEMCRMPLGRRLSMSISDIWHELQFFCMDIANYTYAEEQVDRYRKVVKGLDKNIPECEDILDQVKREGQEIHEQYQNNENCATGEMMTYFTEKEWLWNENLEEVLGKMESALETAKSRRDEAQNQQLYWEEEVASEEACLRDELWHREMEKESEE